VVQFVAQRQRSGSIGAQVIALHEDLADGEDFLEGLHGNPDAVARDDVACLGCEPADQTSVEGPVEIDADGVGVRGSSAGKVSADVVPFDHNVAGIHQDAGAEVVDVQAAYDAVGPGKVEAGVVSVVALHLDEGNPRVARLGGPVNDHV